jgi:ferritin
MIIKELEKAINAQLNYEFLSSYLYLGMSAYFTRLNLKGFANWMHVQAQEEAVHAMKFYYYLLDRGGDVVLSQIEAPKSEWKSPLAAFEAAYKHELTVTERINDIAELAQKKRDFPTATMIQWYITEQVEEEANALEISQKLSLAKGSPEALFIIDQELAQRVFAIPAGAMIKGLGAAGGGGAA